MGTLLHKTLSSQKKIEGDSFFKERAPEVIYDNIRPDYGKRPYQKEAFGRFDFYWEKFARRAENQPVQLLYHMATGSGKTLIMAGLITYLYKKGYRNFLFFVDSTNIIEKTKQNFLDPVSSKYLFADRIQIEDRQVRVSEVDNFSSANDDDISIVFTTIQGLHSRLNEPRENAVTYQDFENQKVVILSDEAHHINAETKSRSQRTKSDTENLNTWEGTVKRVAHAHHENVMLEFTATMDLGNDAVRKKYEDRIIFDYPLREFFADGYSKDVKLLQADLEPIDRALQAVVLSQYRLKLFADYGLSIKPVIMLKANYVNEPKKSDPKTKVVSSEFRKEFNHKMRTLTAADIKAVKARARTGEAIDQAFNYFDSREISYQNLAMELKEDFTEEKCISVDSTTDKEENQILVNSLEDADNPIRVVFAVNALNEGWDVLNLFDIVRLYDTRDAKRGKPGKTTMAEAQLIGRGARYCPFKIKDEQNEHKRKYDVTDNEQEHVLKICEELFYHSAANSRYISELHTALEDIGIEIRQNVQISLNLKPSFKETDIYKNGRLFLNERKKYRREDITSLDEHARDFNYKASLRTEEMSTSALYDGNASANFKKARDDFRISAFGSRIVKKALSRLPFYRFNNLKKYFPHLTSITEFVESEWYLAHVKVEVTASSKRIQDLSRDDKLDIAVKVLDELSSKIRSGLVTYKGAHRFEPVPLKDKLINKTINFVKDSGDGEHGKSQTDTTNPVYQLPLDQKEWYAFEDNFGTSQEKSFVCFIDKVYKKLQKQYDEIYLIRNEQHFKVYNFDDGKGFAPDFLLYLRKEKPEESLHYQIFIEPKGDHLVEYDEPKENFLKTLQSEYELDQVWKGKGYILWGLPFYNEDNKRGEFENAFNEVISGEEPVEYKV